MNRPLCPSVFFLLALSALAPLAHADTNAASSLFFSDTERATIESLQSTLSMRDNKRCADLITLDALLYFGPENWTAWLQGARLTPASTPNGFQIIAVAPDHVTLRLGDAPQTDITLYPHETYDRSAGHKISHAAVPPACLKHTSKTAPAQQKQDSNPRHHRFSSDAF